MTITFDPAKRQATLDTRGLDMAKAGEVFAGAHVTIADDRRAYGELRYITVGRLVGRMVVIVWTPRAGSTRIISIRKANDREIARYAPRLD